MGLPATGREREAREIVDLLKAQQVGLLLLGQFTRALEPIDVGTHLRRPRRDLIAERERLRRSLRSELNRFLSVNFDATSNRALVRLFDELLASGSRVSLPYAEFVARLGSPRPGVLKGAPPHATIRIDSIHGLQSESPEMHLVRDLAVAFGDALRSSPFMYSSRSSAEVRRIAGSDEGRDKTRRHRLARRVAILSCFNLVEAYVNGVAWDFVRCDGRYRQLSEKDQRFLADPGSSLAKKLVRVPRLISGAAEDPLHDSRDPLRSFLSNVQPYRDSIVHASPFSAPARFGGYEKLSKLYELDTPTVTLSVQTSLSVVSEIHTALGGQAHFPRWMEDFVVTSTKEWFDREEHPWSRGLRPVFE